MRGYVRRLLPISRQSKANLEATLSAFQHDLSILLIFNKSLGSDVKNGVLSRAEYDAWLNRVKKVDALKKKLVELRDEIMARYPDPQVERIYVERQPTYEQRRQLQQQNARDCAMLRQRIESNCIRKCNAEYKRYSTYLQNAGAYLDSCVRGCRPIGTCKRLLRR